MTRSRNLMLALGVAIWMRQSLPRTPEAAKEQEAKQGACSRIPLVSGGKWRSSSKARLWKPAICNPDLGLVPRLSFTSEMTECQPWLSCATSGGEGLAVSGFSGNFTFWLHYSWDSEDTPFLQWSKDWFGWQLFTLSTPYRCGTSHWTAALSPNIALSSTQATN